MRQHPFIVTTERALEALPGWLGKRGCNSCSFSDHSKINVGIESGRKYTYVASILIKDEALFNHALRVVEATLHSSTDGKGAA